MGNVWDIKTMYKTLMAESLPQEIFGDRGIFMSGSQDSPDKEEIDYINIASTGNATDFGDVRIPRKFGSGASSTTRGIMTNGHGGSPADYQSMTEYITIASLGNAIDFGDSTDSRNAPAGGNNNWRAVSAGGVDGGGFDDSSRSDGVKIFQVKIGEACKFCGATEEEDYKFMIEVKELIDFIESQRDGDQYIGFRD